MTHPVECQFDPGTETRLRCTSCEAPICPRCMVPYEVGHKCPNCARQSQSHVLDVTVQHLITAGLGGGIAGYLFGYGLTYFRQGFLSIFMLIIAVWAGRWTGEFLHRLVRYKMGNKITGVLTVSLFTGLFISPFHQFLLFGVMLLTQGAAVGPMAVFSLAFPLIASGIFIAHVRRPFQR